MRAWSCATRPHHLTTSLRPCQSHYWQPGSVNRPSVMAGTSPCRCGSASGHRGTCAQLRATCCCRGRCGMHLHVDLQCGDRIAAVQLDLYLLAIDGHMPRDDLDDLLLQHSEEIRFTDEGTFVCQQHL